MWRVLTLTLCCVGASAEPHAWQQGSPLCLTMSTKHLNSQVCRIPMLGKIHAEKGTACPKLLPLLSLVYSVVPGQEKIVARTGMNMYFASSWGVLALVQAQAQAHTGAWWA